ncbi:hypothetical protein GGI35DRAFT_486961 [Trichoderma velutinum]
MDICANPSSITLLDISHINENCLGRLREVDRKLILSIDTETRFKKLISSWLQENPFEAGLLPAPAKNLPLVLCAFLSQLEAASPDKVSLKQANTNRLLGHAYASINVAIKAIRINQSRKTNGYIFNRLIEQMANLAKNLNLFNQFSSTFSPVQELLQTFFTIYHHIMLFLTQVTLFSRETQDSYEYFVNPSLKAWSEVEQQFLSLTDAFISPYSYIGSLTEGPGTRLQQHILDFHPIVILPPRNTKFFGRESVFDEIHERLWNSPSTTEPIVIALCGLGGIGKSQVAHRPWLVIFDDLDNASVIEDFWPCRGRGSIIVTSVVSDIIFDLNPYVIKVPAFSEAEAIDCFLDQLCLDNTVELNKSWAAKINQELRGYPLAIVRVAAFARSRKLRIEECAEQIELALNEARETSRIETYDDYLKDIHTVWKKPFEELSKNSQAMGLLGMLSYVAAEAIPQALFTPKLSRIELSKNMLFCQDITRLKVVEGHLLHWALIEKDFAGNLSLHRLVQKEVHRFLNGDQKQLAFNQITYLLYHAFPKPNNGRHLHENWEQGYRLSSHIDTLNRHYLNTSSPSQIFPSLDYIRLLNNYTWLLYEKRKCINTQAVLAGLDACEKLKRESESGEIDVIHIYLLNTGAIHDGLRGCFDSQIMKLKQVLKMRKRVLTASHTEIAGILYNLCLANESAMRYPKALKYQQKSLEICLMSPESIYRNKELNKRELIRSRLLLATGRLEEARTLFLVLSHYFESIKNWYFIGHLSIIWGNYCFHMRDFKESINGFSYALQQYEKVGKVVCHSDAVACLYKIGRVALEVGNLDYAIEAFREAIRRLQLTDPMSSQFGRIYFMLATALKKTDGDNTNEIGELENKIRDIVQALRPQQNLSAGITEDLLDSLVYGIIR